MGSRISLEKRGNRSVQESYTGNEINICIFRFYFCHLKNIEIYRFLSPGGGKLPFVKLQCVFILKQSCPKQKENKYYIKITNKV